MIEAGGLRLVVPADALVDDVEVTVTPLAALRGSPLDDGLIGGARLAPEGLRFFEAATLIVPAPPGLDSGDVVAFSAGGDGGDLHLTPHLATTDEIEIPLWHFSSSGAATADPEALGAVMGHEPTSGEARAAAAIAAANRALVVADERGDPSASATHAAAIADALRIWFGDVRTGLQAVDGSISFFELAAGEWASWSATVAFYDVADALDAELTESATLALDAGSEVARQLLRRCDGEELASEIRDAARVATILQLMPSVPIEERTDDTGDSPRQLPNGFELVDACVHVEVSEISHPRALAANAKNPISVEAAAVFWATGERRDVELLFRRLDHRGDAVIVVDSAVVVGGLWETSVDPGAAPVGTLGTFTISVDA